jgi:hypothetical protein
MERWRDGEMERWRDEEIVCGVEGARGRVRRCFGE